MSLNMLCEQAVAVQDGAWSLAVTNTPSDAIILKTQVHLVDEFQLFPAYNTSNIGKLSDRLRTSVQVRKYGSSATNTLPPTITRIPSECELCR